MFDGWLLFPKEGIGKWLRTCRQHASAPLRLCASATKRLAVRGSQFAYQGALEERQRPLLCRRDAEAQRLVTDRLLRLPKRNLGNGPHWPTARLCASAPLRFSSGCCRSSCASARFAFRGVAHNPRQLTSKSVVNEPRTTLSQRRGGAEACRRPVRDNSPIVCLETCNNLSVTSLCAPCASAMKQFLPEAPATLLYRARSTAVAPSAPGRTPRTAASAPARQTKTPRA
mgnify:CR=1 FL=1